MLILNLKLKHARGSLVPCDHPLGRKRIAYDYTCMMSTCMYIGMSVCVYLCVYVHIYISTRYVRAYIIYIIRPETFESYGDVFHQDVRDLQVPSQNLLHEAPYGCKYPLCLRSPKPLNPTLTHQNPPFCSPYKLHIRAYYNKTPQNRFW